MDPAFVFAYGSLLAGADGVPCRLAGHRRRFGVAMDNRRTLPGYKYFLDAATGARPAVFVAFLDVVEDPAASVQGVAFPVTAAGLAGGDDRERN
jgi:cation transport regulator ChaC